MKSWKRLVVALAVLVLVPVGAAAQSSIAGEVTDNTGGVLPGVTVEASSPALIGGARVAITDGTGRYNLIALTPGLYSVSFTLPGFGTQVRDEITLEAAFAMTIDVGLSVGALEESVTVSGEAPVVDVQQVQRTEVLTREVQEAIPTGRSMWSYAQLIPGVRIHKPDVGGTSGAQQAIMWGPGAEADATATQVDGLSISTYIGDGAWNAYLNPMMTAETSYTTSGIGAETQLGGLRINMIPAEGGNQFSGAFFAGGSPSAGWQSDNWNQRLGDLGAIKGLTPHIDRIYDLNMSVGGPIMRDRVWFYMSTRRNILNNIVLNSTNRDGTAGIDDNALTSALARVTVQITDRDKFSIMFDKVRKRRFHVHYAGWDRETAAESWTSPHYDTGTAKWTSAISSRMLAELGFSLAYEDWDPGYQPGIMADRPTENILCVSTPCYPAVGSPAALMQSNDWYAGTVATDSYMTGMRYNAKNYEANNYTHHLNVTGAVSYVTGAHNFKVGFDNAWGSRRSTNAGNGDLERNYENVANPWGSNLGWVAADHFSVASGNTPGLQGAPYYVGVYNHPANSKGVIDYDFGAYAQDSWTLDRLTLNYGLRIDQVAVSGPQLPKMQGRFVDGFLYDEVDFPVEVFDSSGVLNPGNTAGARRPIPTLGPDFSPRLSAAYDVFGNAKTALKASWNRYVSAVGDGYARRYLPSTRATQWRVWDDVYIDPTSVNYAAGYHIPCATRQSNPAACANPYGTNGDNIAQDWEIGPSSNVLFGQPAGRDIADPNLERTYNDVWTIGLQQEIVAGVSFNAEFRHRAYHDTSIGDNYLRTYANFGTSGTGEASQTEILRPAPYVGSFTVYNIDPLVRTAGGLELDRTRAPGTFDWVYNGFEVSSTARLPGGGTLFGGWVVEKTVFNDCEDERLQGDNPNDQRWCDGRAFPAPYTHELKLSGVLPFDVPFLGDFNLGFAVLGLNGGSGWATMSETFNVSRTSTSSASKTGRYIAPLYTAANCVAPCVLGARIVEVGTTGGVPPTIGTSNGNNTFTILPANSTKFLPRMTQVDVNFAKVFNVLDWRYDVRLEVFNALNNKVERTHSGTRGTSAGLQSSYFERVATLLDGRVFRVAITARF